MLSPPPPSRLPPLLPPADGPGNPAACSISELRPLPLAPPLPLALACCSQLLALRAAAATAAEWSGVWLLRMPAHHGIQAGRVGRCVDATIEPGGEGGKVRRHQAGRVGGCVGTKTSCQPCMPRPQ